MLNTLYKEYVYVCVGEDNLFGIVEKCFTWESSYCSSIVSTVECALEILDKIIVYKKFHVVCIFRFNVNFYVFQLFFQI